MNEATLKNIVEAMLLSANLPLSLQQILNCFEDWEQVDKKILKTVIGKIKDDYTTRGMELVEVANGYRIQTRREFSQWIAKLENERPQRYSRAFMETLAIIAYKQPVTRADIEDIRGVAVSTNIIKALLEREWIKVAGHRDVPGKPAVYVTTPGFLQYFNLPSLSELPMLVPVEAIE